MSKIRHLVKDLPPTVKRLGWVSLFTDAASDMIYPLLPAFLGSMGAGGRWLGMMEGVAGMPVGEVAKTAPAGLVSPTRRRHGLAVVRAVAQEQVNLVGVVGRRVLFVRREKLAFASNSSDGVNVRVYRSPVNSSNGVFVAPNNGMNERWNGSKDSDPRHSVRALN